MSRDDRPVIRYVLMGRVERRRGIVNGRARVDWCTGYSRNGTEQPWLTRRECYAEARAENARAVFVVRRP